jgi:hypothetical protein
MNSIWRVPPIALLLFLVLFCGGLGIGAWIGDWSLPFIVAFAHAGWSEVCRIPISERIFAEVPAFIDKESSFYEILNVSRIVLVLAGMTVLGLLGKRWWEYLVITKYGWMTREEVEEFYKRGGDAPGA